VSFVTPEQGTIFDPSIINNQNEFNLTNKNLEFPLGKKTRGRWIFRNHHLLYKYITANGCLVTDRIIFRDSLVTLIHKYLTPRFPVKENRE